MTVEEFFMCGKKNRYSSKRIATAKLATLSKARRNRKRTLRIYCCPYCHGFHLTCRKPKD